MINGKDKIIKSNDKYLIINKDNKYVFKISQRAGTNLEKEFNIIEQLRLKSNNYRKVLPETLVDKKNFFFRKIFLCSKIYKRSNFI